MTASLCTSAVCDKPADDWFVCKQCADMLVEVLEEVSQWLLADLELVVTRQVRYGDGSGRKARETPVMFNVKASEVRDRLVSELITTARMIAESNNWDEPAEDPAAWLAYRISAIRLHEAGGQVVDDICRLVADARWVCDRPPEKWYAGVCSMGLDDGTECDEHLYASRDTGTIVCVGCGNAHDIASRRHELLKHAENVLATASEAARAIVVWSDYTSGENRLVKRIGTWVKRGRIAQRGHVTEHGKRRPTYLIGDILDLLGEEARDTAEMAAS